MPHISKLGLGTVQFGMSYGISGPAHRVDNEEVRAILALGWQRGIRVLDSAPAYGESETVLGHCIPEGARFLLVTKTPPLRAGHVSAEEISAIERSLVLSLERLRCDSLYAVLVHHIGDVLAPGGQRVMEMLEQWKANGRIQKIGISVYTSRDLEEVLAKYKVDIVQLPVNVFDQRLVRDGTLAQLGGLGIEIHARSVFLQGLLLMDESALPRGLKFAGPVLSRFRERLRVQGTTPLQAAIGYVARIREVGTIILGVHSSDQLQECLDALECAPELDYSEFACDDISILDPRQWPH